MDVKTRNPTAEPVKRWITFRLTDLSIYSHYEYEFSVTEPG